MSKAVFYCSFKLKKGVSIPEYLEASKKLNDGFISKQKGFVSWKQLCDKENDTWADYITFETMDDTYSFVENSSQAGELAESFYSFINLNSCKQHFYTVEVDHS